MSCACRGRSLCAVRLFLRVLASDAFCGPATLPARARCEVVDFEAVFMGFMVLSRAAHSDVCVKVVAARHSCVRVLAANDQRSGGRRSHARFMSMFHASFRYINTGMGSCCAVHVEQVFASFARVRGQ